MGSWLPFSLRPLLGPPFAGCLPPRPDLGPSDLPAPDRLAISPSLAGIILTFTGESQGSGGPVEGLRAWTGSNLRAPQTRRLTWLLPFVASRLQSVDLLLRQLISFVISLSQRLHLLLPTVPQEHPQPIRLPRHRGLPPGRPTSRHQARQGQRFLSHLVSALLWCWLWLLALLSALGEPPPLRGSSEPGLQASGQRQQHLEESRHRIVLQPSTCPTGSTLSFKVHSCLLQGCSLHPGTSLQQLAIWRIRDPLPRIPI